MPNDLAAWWHAVRPRLVACSEGDPLPADALEARLREAVAAHVAPAPPASRVVLPADFRAYLDAIGPTLWLGQRITLDFLLMPAAGVLGSFEHALACYADPEDVGVRGAGVWVEFARRGDHTAWFLCCDPARPEFGRVGVGDDAHPWLNGVAWLRPLTTFAAWLKAIRAWPARPRTPVLLALDAADAAALDRARATGDAREVLIAVRALVDRRTPDSAWSHTLGAPERALLVRPREAVERALARAGAARVHDSPALTAYAHAGEVALPATLPAWSVLAWDPAKGALRAVEDAGGRLAAFVRAAADAGHALLWVVEPGGLE